MKKNKGITLIALIITIIVMLILVGVVVQVVIQSDLLGTAKTTGDKFKTAYEDESKMSGIKANGKNYDSIEDYMAGKVSIPEIHNWQRNGDDLTCSHCNTALKIGDELRYVPTTGTGSSSISMEKAAGYTGPDAAEHAQIIHSDTDTRWIVLGIEDSNNNGTNETLLLTTKTPTTEKMQLYGAAAYNNCIEEINRMCVEIYGEDARGMTIDDVNACVQYTPTAGMYILSGSTWNITENLTTKLIDIEDLWSKIVDYNKDKKSGMFYDPANPDGIENNGTVLGEYNLNGYAYVADSTVSSSTQSGMSILTDSTTTTKTLIFGEANDINYWLASRAVTGTGSQAFFGPGMVSKGSVTSYSGLFGSGGFSSNLENSLRAVISIRTDIPEVVDSSENEQK